MSERRKVCTVGATAVGKTSLVNRFVRSVFSETYRTTIGVTIDKRTVEADGRRVDLIVWDLSGEDEFQSVSTTYMQGAAGFLVVIDGTRRGTLDTALRLQEEAQAAAGDVPFVFVLNKADLTGTWEIDEVTDAGLAKLGWPVVRTSAKTGEGVDQAFAELTHAMMMRRRASAGGRR
jgi:small GTP-binding protein